MPATIHAYQNSPVSNDTWRFIPFSRFCLESGLVLRLSYKKIICLYTHQNLLDGRFMYPFNIWAASSEFVSSSIPSWQILTAHAQPFRGARDLAFCLKVPLDSLLVWASSKGSGETARMRRLAWTFAARIGDKDQIRLTRPIWSYISNLPQKHTKVHWKYYVLSCQACVKGAQWRYFRFFILWKFYFPVKCWCYLSKMK